MRHLLITVLVLPLPFAVHAGESDGKLRVVARQVGKTASHFHTSIYADPDRPRLINRHFASDDNGKKWTPNPLQPNFLKDLPKGFRREPVGAMLDARGGRVLLVLNALDTAGLDTRINEPAIAQQNYYMRYRVSTDGGRTWLFDEPVIQKGAYHERHPVQGIWVGQNAVYLGDLGSVPITNRDGNVLVPVQLTLRDVEGKLAKPGGVSTFTDVAVLIGTWTKDHRLEWRMSQRVQIDPARSSRGLIEPTLVEADDGRLLMVMRGSNERLPRDPKTGATPPGYRWAAVSTDGGYTWSKPAPWSYDDGKPFFTPSSMSTLLRHSSGRIFWVGNIVPADPQGNLPRHPLVMGEVDQKTLRLIRASVLTVDQEEPADQEQGRLDLSHFHVLEDRVTKEIILTYPRAHNAYKSMEWALVRVAVQ